jgi:hypothetical protein
MLWCRSNLSEKVWEDDIQVESSGSTLIVFILRHLTAVKHESIIIILLIRDEVEHDEVQMRL